MRKYLLYLMFISLLACDTGTPFENMAPETRIFLEEINLSGDARLNSVVRLHWTGEDQDGYIKGYELSFDQQNWHFVTITDSTFRLPLNSGVDTADIDFYVRAMDDDDALDPSPAYLGVPIKNTPPEIRMDTVNLLPDTVFLVWSFQWTVDDLDGFETLDSIFFRLNDGAWYGLDPNTSFLTIEPTDPLNAGQQAGRVYAGGASDPLPRLVEGLSMGGSNQIFLRAQDITGSFSEWDSSAVFYLRQQQSDLLMIDMHRASGVESVYFPIFDAVYPSYDYFNLEENLPTFWDPTFALLLAQYDKVFWYSEGSQLDELGDRLAMEVASGSIQEYLNQGGKLMASISLPNPFPNTETPNQSTLFDFSPMDSLSTSLGQARLPEDSLAVAQGDFAGSFPNLTSAAFITGLDPFYPKDPTHDMYHAQLFKVGGWTGPATICARTVFTNGQTNQVFFSVELHRLNKDPMALQMCFDQILNTEFNW